MGEGPTLTLKVLELTSDVDLCMTVLLKLFGSVGKTKLDNLCPQSLQRSVAQWDLGKSPLWNQLLVECLSNHVMSKVGLLFVWIGSFFELCSYVPWGVLYRSGLERQGALDLSPGC